MELNYKIACVDVDMKSVLGLPGESLGFPFSVFVTGF